MPKRPIAEFAEAAKSKSVVSKFNSRKADSSMKFSTELQFALSIISDSKILPSCNPNSLPVALLSAADCGLTLNPALRQAYLIPRDGKVRFSPSYLGLKHLAQSTGSIRMIQAELVHEGDTFRHYMADDMMMKIEHEKLNKAKAPVTHAWCVTLMTDGSRHVEVMTKEELDQCREAAISAQNGTIPFSWKLYEGEMQKKCVTRREMKHLMTISERLASAVHAMDLAEPMAFEDSAPTTMSAKQIGKIKAAAKSLDIDWDRVERSLCNSYSVEKLTQIEAKHLDKIIAGLEKAGGQQ